MKIPPPLITTSIFEQSFDQAAVGMAHAELGGKILRVNSKLCEMLGYTQSALLQLTMPDLAHPDDRQIGFEYINKVHRGELENFTLTRRYLKQNGEIIWALYSVALIKNKSGSPLCFICVLIDITDKIKIEKELELLHHELEMRIKKRTAELNTSIEALNGALKQKLEIKKSLREERQNLKSIADHLPALVSSLDANLCYTFNNKTFANWFNIPADQVVGKPIRSIIGSQAFNYLSPHFKSVLSGNKVTCEHLLNGRYGEIYVQTILIPCHGLHGAKFHCFMINITEQKQLQDQYEFEASHDVLTGLPNRRAFMKKLHHMIEVSPPTNLTVIFIDVDDFKGINDNFGHEIGDLALIKIAETLRTICSKDGMVARLAGDEFVVLLYDMISPNTLLPNLCVEILAEIKKIKYIKALQITISVSIGATLIESFNNVTPSEVLSKADSAMYQAKLQGKNRFFIS